MVESQMSGAVQLPGFRKKKKMRLMAFDGVWMGMSWPAGSGPLPPTLLPKGDSLSLSPAPELCPGSIPGTTERLPSYSIKQTVPLTAVGKTGREAVPGDPGRARLLLGAALVGGPWLGQRGCGCGWGWARRPAQRLLKI